MDLPGSKPTDNDEMALVKRALNKDQGAFLKLYDRYKPGVALHVAGLIPIREEAEDVVVESFAKAFAQLSSYDPQYRFSTWIYRIARNTALDHLEKNGRETNNMPTNSIDDASAGLDTIPAVTGNPEVEIINSQEYDKLLRAIELLPDDYRTIAHMLLIDNYGYQEIADKLELPLNTVRTRIRRGRERILKIMNTDDEAL